ncbi:hypothetical protein Hypma_012434 [Hypsizygus marmoreus]|uniref:Protein kinase domain-containing protein n=1 Tax=Hypsizygus marmoreus TaxID=39966 RepID=A0A369JE77_HYPMA|nr:hypothetical protein Hypma_012434 [Hypsizygus marmoreus]
MISIGKTQLVLRTESHIEVATLTMTITLNIGFEHDDIIFSFPFFPNIQQTQVGLKLLDASPAIVEVQTLRFFKPLDPHILPCDPRETLHTRKHALGKLEAWCGEWQPAERLQDIFSKEERMHVNLIVRVRQLGWPKPCSASTSAITYPVDEPLFSPFLDEQLSSFKTHQENRSTRVYCGRPAAAVHAIPPSLLHPVFAQFVEDCQTYSPTVLDHDCIDDLTYKMSDIFSCEGERIATLRDILRSNDMSFRIDEDTGIGLKHLTMGAMTSIFAILDGRGEVGVQGPEPLLHSIRVWMESVVRIEEQYPLYYTETNHPCLFILYFGPYISIAGGVYTDKRPNVQMLSPILPLHTHPTDTPSKMIGARCIGALKKAIKSLDAYYTSLTCDRSIHPQPDYPFPSSYTDITTEQLVHFRYLSQANKDKLVFFGQPRPAEPESICVKFVHQYSKDAHAVFATLGCAPKLRALERLPGGWFLVVMDDVRRHYRPYAPLTDRTPTLHTVVKASVQKVHELGYVHGNICHENLMVSIEDQTRFVLLGFDLAGKVGDGLKYPMNGTSSAELWRPPGAAYGLPILQEHDLKMIDHIFIDI